MTFERSLQRMLTSYLGNGENTGQAAEFSQNQFTPLGGAGIRILVGLSAEIHPAVHRIAPMHNVEDSFPCRLQSFRRVSGKSGQ